MAEYRLIKELPPCFDGSDKVLIKENMVYIDYGSICDDSSSTAFSYHISTGPIGTLQECLDKHWIEKIPEPISMVAYTIVHNFPGNEFKGKKIVEQNLMSEQEVSARLKALTDVNTKNIYIGKVTWIELK